MLTLINPIMDVSLYGQYRIDFLMTSLCGGFLYFQKRPDAFEEFLDEMPVHDLTVTNEKTKTTVTVLNNKQFDRDAFDIAMADIDKLSQEERNLSSPRMRIKVLNTTMRVYLR